MKRLKKNIGFTLIEAVVSVAIAGIIIVPLGMIMASGLSTTADSRRDLKATQLAQSHIEQIKYDDVSTANGYIEKKDADDNTYYEKAITEGTNKVIIEVYPDFYNGILGGKNELMNSDNFADKISDFDSSNMDSAIPILGDLATFEGNNYSRIVTLTYNIKKQSSDKNVCYVKCVVEEDMNGSLGSTTSITSTYEKTFEMDEVTYDFMLLYDTLNLEDLSDIGDFDLIKIKNQAAEPINLYILKSIDMPYYPEIDIELGIVNVIKDVSSDLPEVARRLYKTNVKVIDANNNILAEIEATKNDRK